MESVSRHHQKKWILDRPLIPIWIISAIILAFSFYHQYIGKVEPCLLCKWQRIIYLLIFTLSPMGLFEKFHGPIRGVLSFIFFIGFCLASYHALVQIGWLVDRCVINQKIENMTDFMKMLEQPKTTCATIGWKLFGLSASFYNALLSLLVIICLNAKNFANFHLAKCTLKS